MTIYSKLFKELQEKYNKKTVDLAVPTTQVMPQTPFLW